MKYLRALTFDLDDTLWDNRAWGKVSGTSKRFPDTFFCQDEQTL